MKLARLTAGAALLAFVCAGAFAQDAKPASKTAAKPAAKGPQKNAAPPALQMVLEPRAMALLRESADKLAAAKTISFTATAGFEFPSKLGPPIVYTTRYDVTMQRPDKLRVVMPGDGPASEYYYDGTSMMAYAPAENLVAVASAPPTIDAALKQAYDRAAIYFPFTDLLVANPYEALTEGAILAFYVGPSSVVGGVKTEMVAWANDDVYLQIWIGADDKLPRRVRAMYRQDPLRLRHELEISNWKLDEPMSEDTFVSAKAESAPRMAFANPSASVPAGVKPITERKPSRAPAKSAAKAP